jgi:hypothetical protein
MQEAIRTQANQLAHPIIGQNMTVYATNRKAESYRQPGAF